MKYDEIIKSIIKIISTVPIDEVQTELEKLFSSFNKKGNFISNLLHIIKSIFKFIFRIKSKDVNENKIKKRKTKRKEKGGVEINGEDI